MILGGQQFFGDCILGRPPVSMINNGRLVESTCASDLKFQQIEMVKKKSKKFFPMYILPELLRYLFLSFNFREAIYKTIDSRVNAVIANQ